MRGYFTGNGLRPSIRQGLTLGASDDGKLQVLTHENISETSLDDDYVEGGAATAKVMYTVPNLSATQKLVRINSFTPSWKRAPGLRPTKHGSRHESALSIRHLEQ